MNPPPDKTLSGRVPITRLMVKLNRERGITVLTITHAMDLVMEFVNRVVVMGQGQVLLDGDMRDVFSQPEILAQTSCPNRLNWFDWELNLD